MNWNPFSKKSSDPSRASKTNGNKSMVRRSVRIFWRIFLIGFAGLFLLIALANFGVFGKMPSLADLENPSIQQASEVYAVDGTLMGKYYTERGNRSNVKYRDISKHVI